MRTEKRLDLRPRGDGMSKASISIGTDSAGRQSKNASPHGAEGRKPRRAVGPARGGQDPTRSAPAGSRTETRIAKESALGSDRAGGRNKPASAVTPDLPDELRKRPKGPAQP
jgi:hypothetical protein